MLQQVAHSPIWPLRNTEPSAAVGGLKRPSRLAVVVRYGNLHAIAVRLSSAFAALSPSAVFLRIFHQSLSIALWIDVWESVFGEVD